MMNSFRVRSSLMLLLLLASSTTGYAGVSTIAFSNFDEPPLNATSFTPSTTQVELGFTTTTTPTGGIAPVAAVQLAGTNPTFTHRSISATTTFTQIDLVNWLEPSVSVDIEIAETTYEAGDFLHVFITNGGGVIDLFNETATSAADGLDNAATGSFVTYSAEIPPHWGTASLVFASSSNSSQAAERFIIDNVRFTGVAVPEPASIATTLIGIATMLLYRQRRSKTKSIHPLPLHFAQ